MFRPLVSCDMPGNPLTDPNWAPDLADRIASFVGSIRDKTTNNAIKVATGKRLTEAPMTPARVIAALQG